MAWDNALTAMRERSSVAEILALHDGGAITICEVLDGALRQCYYDPILRAELLRQFRAHPGGYIAYFVGCGPEQLGAQLAESRAGGNSCS
jgi:hypothetical protein